MLATKWQGSGGVILGSCMIGRMLGRCGVGRCDGKDGWKGW